MGIKLSNDDDIEILIEEDENFTIEETLEEEADFYNFIKNKSIISEPKDYPIESLYSKQNRGFLILHPPYQRNFVWDKSKASNLIESILLDIPIPPIFVSKGNGEILEVIDGQQRLKSIFSFIEGTFPSGNKNERIMDFKLSKLKILSKLKGQSFKDLDVRLQEKILNKTIHVIVIYPNNEIEDIVKFEMFERLNTNTT